MFYEKVLFVYTSLIREGTAANALPLPEPLLYGIDHNELQVLAVTASFVHRASESYWHEVDIIFNDESMIDPAYDNRSTFNMLRFSSPIKDHTSTTASFHIHGIKLPMPGIYTASLKLYDCYPDGNKRNELDKKECNFIVSGEI